MNEFAPKVYVLMTPNNSKSIILRRGPSKMFFTIGWDRDDDTFLYGQWLKGRIYPYRCDISFDGKYWLYFAMGKRGNTYTGLAKYPYLKALDFYGKNDAWNGGGLFYDQKTYWLNEISSHPHKQIRKQSNFKRINQWYHLKTHMGEDPAIYFLRLLRDGWKQLDFEGLPVRFEKRVNDDWYLQRTFTHGHYTEKSHPIGYFEVFHLVNHLTNESYQCFYWDWSEFDSRNQRIVWTTKGKLMAGNQIVAGDIINSKVLLDLNEMTFEEIVAPY